ncbi:MAG: hypothetical protein AAFQ68_07130, partial [Bacteroidota bacterium]
MLSQVCQESTDEPTDEPTDESTNELAEEGKDKSTEESVEEENNKSIYGLAWQFAPPEELTYLQVLMENPSHYQRRRHQFLDHLLARFAEQFTDYSLQMYAMFGQTASTDQALLEVKSSFLSRYDQLAHNRGQAFDYGQHSWGTPNFSGLEANLAARLGVDWTRRQSLCPFVEITYPTEYELQLLGPQAGVWMVAGRTYGSVEPAYQDLQLAISKLREGGNWQSG